MPSGDPVTHPAEQKGDVNEGPNGFWQL
jgi:hypothetical protein